MVEIFRGILDSVKICSTTSIKYSRPATSWRKVRQMGRTIFDSNVFDRPLMVLLTFFEHFAKILRRPSHNYRRVI